MRCNYKQGFISLKKIKTVPFTKKKKTKATLQKF